MNTAARTTSVALLGKQLGEMVEKITVEPSSGETVGGFVVGDKVTFHFADDGKPLMQFVVTCAGATERE